MSIDNTGAREVGEVGSGRRKRPADDALSYESPLAKRRRVVSSSNPRCAVLHVRHGETGDGLYADGLVSFENIATRSRDDDIFRPEAYVWDDMKRYLQEMAGIADTWSWYMSASRKDVLPRGRLGMPVNSGGDFRFQMAKYAQDGVLPTDESGYYGITFWVYPPCVTNEDGDRGDDEMQDTDHRGTAVTTLLLLNRVPDREVRWDVDEV